MAQQKARQELELVTATEVASYVYCPEAWRLQHGLGHPSENYDSLKRGDRYHDAMSSMERGSRRVLVVGIVLLLAAALILVISYGAR